MTSRGRTLVACVLALLCAMPALWSRVSAEQEPADVALVVSDSAIAGWSAAGRDEAEIGAVLKAANISTVLVGMRSIDSLIRTGELAVVPPDEVPDGLDFPPGKGTYLHASDPNDVELFTRAVRALTAWYGDRVHSGVDPATGLSYLRADGIESVRGVPVLYDRARLRALIGNEVAVMLALPARLPTGNNGWLEQELAEVRELRGGGFDVKPLDEVPYAGDPGQQRALARFLDDLGMRLVLDDLTDNSGAETYSDELPGRVLRSHTVVVTPADDVETLTVRARRAIKERGVGVIVLRTLVDGRTAGGEPESVTAVATRLGDSPPAGTDVTAGRATPLPAVDSAGWVRFAAMLGALLLLGAAGLQFVGLRIPIGRGRSLRISGVLVGAVLTGLVVFGSIAVEVNRAQWLSIMQLATGVAGAVLAALVVVAPGASASPTGVRAVLGFLSGAGVAAATGLVLAGLGAQPRYLVGVTTFAGVKVLLLAPPIIVAVYGLLTTIAVPGGGRGLSVLAHGLRPIHGVLGVLVLAGLGYLVLRSGNYGFAPGFELWLRDLLDEALYVRPRFKEALLGFPALMLAASWRGVLGRWIFAALGGIGTAGVVDTFAHFHTPVLVGLLRTAYSVAIGLVLGWLARRVLLWAWARWRARVADRSMELVS